MHIVCIYYGLEFNSVLVEMALFLYTDQSDTSLALLLDFLNSFTSNCSSDSVFKQCVSRSPWKLVFRGPK